MNEGRGTNVLFMRIEEAKCGIIHADDDEGA